MWLFGILRAFILHHRCAFHFHSHLRIYAVAAALNQCFIYNSYARLQELAFRKEVSRSVCPEEKPSVWTRFN